MIKPTQLINQLRKQIVFKRLNRSKSAKLNRRISRMRSQYYRNGLVPEKDLRTFVRLNLRQSIGIILSDSKKDKLVLKFSEHPEFEKVWSQTKEVLLSKREWFCVSDFSSQKIWSQLKLWFMCPDFLRLYIFSFDFLWASDWWNYYFGAVRPGWCLHSNSRTRMELWNIGNCHHSL